MFFGGKKVTTRNSSPAAPRLDLEVLEERTLLSVSLRGGVLTLLGSARADQYSVALNAPATARIVVSENGRVAIRRGSCTVRSAPARLAAPRHGLLAGACAGRSTRHG